MSTQVVGKAFIVYGTVKAESSDGLVRQLAPNDPIYADDRIITNDGSSISIQFNGEGVTQLDLGRMTNMVIDHDVYGSVVIGDNTDITAQVTDIQKSILDGSGDIQLDATAAGGDIGAGGGHTTFDLSLTGQEGLVGSGAGTIGPDLHIFDGGTLAGYVAPVVPSVDLSVDVPIVPPVEPPPIVPPIVPPVEPPPIVPPVEPPPIVPPVEPPPVEPPPVEPPPVEPPPVEPPPVEPPVVPPDTVHPTVSVNIVATELNEHHSHQNNGFGNGDQDAPGHSGEHNHAENFIHGNEGHGEHNGHGEHEGHEGHEGHSVHVETSDVTFHFSEAPGTTFTSSDLIVIGGEVSNLHIVNDGTGLNYVATFTATKGFDGTASITVKDASYTDAAGNTGSAGSDTVKIGTIEHHGDKDHGDKDHGDKDHGDKDHGDKDHGDKDHGDKDHGDKDHGNQDTHGHSGDHGHGNDFSGDHGSLLDSLLDGHHQGC